MFEVGDNVRVKEDANTIISRFVTFVPDMYQYKGKEFTIKSYRNYCYNLEGVTSASGYYWKFDESWLELCNNNKIDIKEDDFEELLCLKSENW